MTQISLLTQAHGCSRKHGSVIIFLLQSVACITKKATRSPWCLATHFQLYHESCNGDRTRGQIHRCRQNISQEQRLIYARSKTFVQLSASGIRQSVPRLLAKGCPQLLKPRRKIQQGWKSSSKPNRTVIPIEKKQVPIDKNIIENQCSIPLFSIITQTHWPRYGLRTRQ